LGNLPDPNLYCTSNYFANAEVCEFISDLEEQVSIKTRLIAAGLTSALVTAGTLAYQWEGEVATPYKDIVNVTTVCIGHTGTDIKQKLYSQNECTQIFIADLRKAEATVERCTPNVTGGPKAAFTSFVFNSGSTAYCNSTLAHKANQGDLKGACHQLTRWVYAGKTVSPGLLNRRLAEQRVCFEGPL
jgi:lysozyme